MNKSSNLINSYFNFWKRCLDIKGRSTRSEFWHPFWINFLITSLLGIFSVATLSSLFALITFIPFFTVITRRLHDSNRSMIFAIIYYIGRFIINVVLIIIGISTLFVMINLLEFGLFRTTLIASAFGIVIPGIVLLYILYLLAKPGNKKINKYGSGGSCQDAKLLVEE